MNIWIVLGIEPTNEITVIKKAYARKLKITQPDDDPEGFQQLREAYDCALKYLKREAEITQKEDEYSDINTKIPGEVKTSRTNSNEELIRNVNYEAIDSIEKIVEVLINEVGNLYYDFLARVKIENWELLFYKKFNQDIFMDIDIKHASSNAILNFLMDHQYIPRCVWKLLDMIFEWYQQEEYLYKNYPRNFVDYIIMQLKEPEVFHYCYFNEYDNFDFDRFLKFREEAYYALLNNKFSDMADCIKFAFEMCPDDPDLLRILAEFHLLANDKKEALDTINRAIYPHSDFLDGFLLRAKIYIDMKNIKKAIIDCNYILLRNPDNIEALILIAECHFAAGNIIKAKRLLKAISKHQISDKRRQESLSKFNNRIIHKFACIVYECIWIFPILFILELILGTNFFELDKSFDKLLIDVSLYIVLRIIWLLYSIGIIGNKYKYLNDQC